MNNDTRKLSQDVQIALRKQAIQMRERKMNNEEISEIIGVRADTISRWWGIYKKEGEAFFKSKTRGRKKGEHRTMTPEQEKEIQKLIVDKTPDQLKFKFALWNRQAVQELIGRLYKITIPIRTIGEYLKRWGFTPQKPLKQAYEQSPKAVQEWLDDIYPEIHKQAKTQNAEIHWGDETGLRNDAQCGRGYLPKGKTPVQRIPAKRTGTNMISSITNQGKVRFMGYRGSMNSDVLILFLKQLIKGAKQKIFLILDNLRVHHSKIVKEWVGKHSDYIELFYLPSYSPELNPDEYLNNDLKTGVHSTTPAKTQKNLEEKLQSHMRLLQGDPQRVKNYFKHPKIAYAS